MAMSMNWSWAVPKIQVSNASEQSMGNALSSIGESLGSLQRARYQKEQNRLAQERQAMLDQQAAEDRQRRIAEEERIQGVRGQMADRLAGNSRMAATLQGLKQQQLELQTAISQIKSKWGM